jgi:predicted nucleotidyltransferase component of viral defense system
MFIHEDREFTDLIQIVANKLGLARAIVEKDYWVTHALWSLADSGFEVWFKGGTSLSKGFALIKRFSEDLDLKLEHPEIQQPPNWTSAGDDVYESHQVAATSAGRAPRRGSRALGCNQRRLQCNRADVLGAAPHARQVPEHDRGVANEHVLIALVGHRELAKAA